MQKAAVLPPVPLLRHSAGSGNELTEHAIMRGPLRRYRCTKWPGHWVPAHKKAKLSDQEVSDYGIQFIAILLKMKIFHIPFPQNIFIFPRTWNKSQLAPE
jgi:hypothetical protein